MAGKSKRAIKKAASMFTNSRTGKAGSAVANFAKEGAGLGVDSMKASADFNKKRMEKIYGSVKKGFGGKTDPKKLNFKPIDKSQKNMNGVSRRTTDKYDKQAHNSGLFTKQSVGTAAGDLRNLGRAGTEARDNINLDGGWKSIAGGAGSGAVAGGLAGAGVNMIRGEDAWEGAKSGAMMGAIGNGAVKGSRTAIGASKGQKFGEAFNSFNAQTNMTKSVKSLHTLAKGTKDAQKMFHKDGMKF